ncbi:sensor histidine kinase [Falsiroseomonas oryzae]|uniref:sensor histidine kinase n=1 Tax=Falsiroseomonas oryzae TaxID=2766473 RepID=UPI0022EB8ACD|nr:ATP-binding protein [Roseomonas sp. MO-31]
MFRLLLTGSFGALLALGLACAAQSWSAAETATYHNDRSRVAEEVLLGHMRLAATTEALLRETAFAALAMPGEQVAPLNARERLGEVFDAVRRAIAAEIALRPQDNSEREEMVRLSAMQIHATGVADRLERAVDLFVAGQFEAGRTMMLAAAAEGFGPEFRNGISAAVQKERAELAETYREASQALYALAMHSKVAALAALIVAGLAVWGLLHGVRTPLNELTLAAAAVAAGDLSRSIPLTNRKDEFGRLARSFDIMVSEVARARAGLEQSRDRLERAVAERTAELAAANASLLRNDETRRRFLADISHELRTPITVIRGEAEIALRGGDKTAADYRQALSRIADESAHTGRLVDDLLFVARSAAGEVRMATRPVALAEVVQNSCGSARTLADARRVEVRERLTPAQGPVLGDPDRLRQAVLILLDNAVRYSEPGGEVSVTLEEQDSSVRLTVADHGAGIPPDEIDRVFDRFYRGDGAADRHAGGSGLGLPLARAIARAHGGDVMLESRPGEGTIARLLLPLARRLPAAA